MEMYSFFSSCVEKYARIMAGKAPTATYREIYPTVNVDAVKQTSEYRKQGYVETATFSYQKLQLPNHILLNTYTLVIKGPFVPDTITPHISSVQKAIYTYATAYLGIRMKYQTHVLCLFSGGYWAPYLPGRILVTLFPRFKEELFTTTPAPLAYKRIPAPMKKIRKDDFLRKHFNELETMLTKLKLMKDVEYTSQPERHITLEIHL